MLRVGFLLMGRCTKRSQRGVLMSKRKGPNAGDIMLKLLTLGRKHSPPTIAENLIAPQTQKINGPTFYQLNMSSIVVLIEGGKKRNL